MRGDGVSDSREKSRLRPENLALDIDMSQVIHRYSMPTISMPKGTLAMLVLRVIRSGPLHGYAIAQRIRQLSGEVLEAEEGSLYPALQRILVEGWMAAEWGTSETGRRVRFYRLTPDGTKQLKRELKEYEQATAAIKAVLRLA
jgi:transcriptional regulator